MPDNLSLFPSALVPESSPYTMRIVEEELSPDQANRKSLLSADLTHLARYWQEGLPIGTGRLAAMVYGSVMQERISLNHEWIWPGIHRKRENQVRSAEELNEVRELLLAEHYEEGTLKGNEYFGGNGGIGSNHGEIDTYSTVGNLLLELGNPRWHDGCTRELDMQRGIIQSSYCTGHLVVTKEYLGHFKEDVLLFRVRAEGGTFDASLALERYFESSCEINFFNDGKNTLFMRGRFEAGTEFLAKATLYTKTGSITFPEGQPQRITIEGTNDFVFAVDIGTDAKGSRPDDEFRTIADPLQNWDSLIASHLAEYESQLTGTYFELEAPTPKTDITAKRLINKHAGDEDDHLVPLLFNYGRYLMAASSHNAELPAHLQGKWNEEIRPAWFSDYHLDLNLQMNYWFIESVNNPDYAEPLLKFIESMVPHGRQAAQDIYGCRGIWFPLQTDAWARATPVIRGWAVWVGAAPWMAQHVWWHYQFGLDVDFLQRRGYPFMKEVALFFEDYLVKDAQGIYQVVPSHSPENSFKEAGSKYPSLGVSAAMDVQLIHNLLTNCIAAAETLNCDDDKLLQWREILENLPSIQVGATGLLLEWDKELTEVDLGHRHISHLFALYPGEQITPSRTPEWAAAARKSLERRIENGAAQTEWAAAWFSLCYSRMGEGDKALEMLDLLIGKFLSPSLLTLMPSRVFQIDGNFGAVAAVVEMLLQGHNDELQFLPALPKKWLSGRIGGLRASGGYSIQEIVWADGRLKQARVESLTNRICTVYSPDYPIQVQLVDGTMVELERRDERFKFRAYIGDTYLICPLR